MNSERKGLIFDKGQLESLTNGVFAILMTILVFNISVPELILFAEGKYASERLSSLLADLWPDISAYIVSFVTLGVYWVAYHRIFRWILYADRALIWVNISFLMTIEIVPFSTTLFTQYLDQQIAIFAYSFNAILAGITVYVLYYYAKQDPELVDKTVPTLIGSRQIIVTTLTYSGAILISFLHLPTSWFLLLLVPIPELISDRYFGRNASP
jgi:uncharacterized membrane protein